MAIGFGDLVPYSQLPGAVAGQESMQAVQQVNAGATQAANAEKAQDEALTANMNTTLQQQKAPSALILSNLKDAQSINHMPIKANYDDLQAAHEKVMAGSDKQPSMLEQHKIMALADEMAQSRAPKFDVNNPGDWLAKQDPTSNQEMTLVKAQALLDGKMYQGDANRDLRERKFGWEQEQAPIKEAGKDRRAGMMFGAPGSVPVKVQTAASGSNVKFENTNVGRALQTTDGRRMLHNPNMAPMLQQVKNHYHDLVSLGDMQKATDFYNTNKEFLDGEQAPPAPKTYKNKTEGSRGPDDASAMQEVQPTQNGLTQTPTITPLEDGQAPPQGTRQVVTVGHKVYGVGDPVSIGGVNYIVTPGNGKQGGLKKVGK